MYDSKENTLQRYNEEELNLYKKDSKEYMINKREKELMNNKCAEKLGLNKFRHIWSDKEPIIYDI